MRGRGTGGHKDTPFLSPHTLFLSRRHPLTSSSPPLFFITLSTSPWQRIDPSLPRAVRLHRSRTVHMQQCVLYIDTCTLTHVYIDTYVHVTSLQYGGQMQLGACVRIVQLHRSIPLIAWSSLCYDLLNKDFYKLRWSVQYNINNINFPLRLMSF